MEVPLNGFPLLTETQPPMAPSRNGHAPRKHKKTDGRFALLNAVVDQKIADMPRSSLAVWLVLYRDARGVNVTISYTDAATRAGCSRAAVIRAMKDLEERKLIRRVQRGNNLTHQASKYVLLSP